MTEMDGAGRIPATPLVRGCRTALVDVAAGGAVRRRGAFTACVVPTRLVAHATASGTGDRGGQHRGRWRRQDAGDDRAGRSAACARIQARRGQPWLWRRGAAPDAAGCTTRLRDGRRRARVDPLAYRCAGGDRRRSSGGGGAASEIGRAHV